MHTNTARLLTAWCLLISFHQLIVNWLCKLFKFWAEDENSFEWMDYTVLLSGWLHLQMAYANSLHKQHSGTSSGRGLRTLSIWNDSPSPKQKDHFFTILMKPCTSLQKLIFLRIGCRLVGLKASQNFVKKLLNNLVSGPRKSSEIMHQVKPWPKWTGDLKSIVMNKSGRWYNGIVTYCSISYLTGMSAMEMRVDGRYASTFVVSVYGKW